MTRIAGEGEREAQIFGFSPLDADGRRFAAWTQVPGDPAIPASQTAYALLQRQDDREYILYLPMCETTQNAVRRAGGTVDVDICHFSSRTSLEAALREFRPSATDPNQPALRLTPVASSQP